MPRWILPRTLFRMAPDAGLGWKIQPHEFQRIDRNYHVSKSSFHFSARSTRTAGIRTVACWSKPWNSASQRCSARAAALLWRLQAGLKAAIFATASAATPQRPLALMPSYTFAATAAAAETCGYKPYVHRRQSFRALPGACLWPSVFQATKLNDANPEPSILDFLAHARASHRALTARNPRGLGQGIARRRSVRTITTRDLNAFAGLIDRLTAIY